jgi:FKBP-type peptidyl-prolyl cis-trans isomerase SlyD
MDFNHPLAGVDLHFEVEVLEIREATKDELDHGHVHGEHGVHH